MALFTSLGGASYAAVSIPLHSVGTRQLRNQAVTYKKIHPNSVGAVRLANGGVVNSKLANGSVSYKKIQPNAVGHVRANLDQLQSRVNGTCHAGSAIAAIDRGGKTTCNATLPALYRTNDATVAVGSKPANVTTVGLPAGGTFVSFANPTITVTSGANAQQVTVSCTLAVGSAHETRQVDVTTSGTANQTTSASIPLQLPSGSGTAAIACAGGVHSGSMPKTTATAQISALQTASNNY